MGEAWGGTSFSNFLLLGESESGRSFSFPGSLSLFCLFTMPAQTRGQLTTAARMVYTEYCRRKQWPRASGILRGSRVDNTRKVGKRERGDKRDVCFPRRDATEDVTSLFNDEQLLECEGGGRGIRQPFYVVLRRGIRGEGPNQLHNMKRICGCGVYQSGTRNREAFPCGFGRFFSPIKIKHPKAPVQQSS